MAMLQEKAASGELKGIKIEEDHQLTHQLFIDDTGIFFKATDNNFQYVREVIMRYEFVLGAHLNLNKSMLIPMYLSGPIPPWMVNSDCKVAAHREVITYLGCPIGFGVTSAMEAEFLLGKVRKRLRNWSNKMLSWDEKSVVEAHPTSQPGLPPSYAFIESTRL